MNKQEIEDLINARMYLYGKKYLYEKTAESKEHNRLLAIAIDCIDKQLTNGWISVSDRLPEEDGYYLTTYHEWSKGEYLPEFDLTYAKILRFYRGEFKMPVCCNDKIEQDIGREVIAWMPLPEPYKEDNDAERN